MSNEMETVEEVNKEEKYFFLKINGKVMPTPSVMSWTIESYDLDSARGIDGSLQRTLICHKEKIQLEWRSADMTPQEIAMVLNAVMPTFFQVTYYSPLSAGMVTKTMYVGSRDVNIYSAIPNRNVVADSLKFNLIER